MMYSYLQTIAFISSAAQNFYLQPTFHETSSLSIIRPRNRRLISHENRSRHIPSFNDRSARIILLLSRYVHNTWSFRNIITIHKAQLDNLISKKFLCVQLESDDSSERSKESFEISAGFCSCGLSIKINVKLSEKCISFMRIK